jgi:hypothetical protein
MEVSNAFTGKFSIFNLALAFGSTTPSFIAGNSDLETRNYE